MIQITKKCGGTVSYFKKVLKTQQSNAICRDFPGGAVVKDPPANAGEMGSIPGLGRSHMPQSN